MDLFAGLDVSVKEPVCWAGPRHCCDSSRRDLRFASKLCQRPTAGSFLAPIHNFLSRSNKALA